MKVHGVIWWYHITLPDRGTEFNVRAGHLGQLLESSGSTEKLQYLQTIIAEPMRSILFLLLTFCQLGHFGFGRLGTRDILAPDIQAQFGYETTDLPLRSGSAYSYTAIRMALTCENMSVDGLVRQ